MAKEKAKKTLAAGKIAWYSFSDDLKIKR